MRILMLSDDYLPNIGGIAAHIYNLSKALITLGHEVVIVNPVKGHEHPITINEQERGLTVYRVPFITENIRYFWVWKANNAAKRGIDQALSDFDHFDILHQHTHLTTVLTSRLYSRRIPWVWTNHTSGFLKDYHQTARKLLVGWLYSKVDGIIAVSRELHDKSLNLWRSKRHTYIPNGVDTLRFNPMLEANRRRFKIHEDEFVILCPRRMVPKNGVLFLAEAVKEVLKENPEANWRFVFLGSDVAENTSASYIQQVKDCLSAYQKYVTYLGNVPMEDMPQLNKLADVVVMPSLIEAVSLSALEAMACRKPLIATNVGGLPEIVHHAKTGILVPPRDPKALAQAILRLYEDHDLRNKVAEGGYNLATKHYSWSVIAKQTAEFYKQVLSDTVSAHNRS